MLELSQPTYNTKHCASLVSWLGIKRSLRDEIFVFWENHAFPLLLFCRPKGLHIHELAAIL